MKLNYSFLNIIILWGALQGFIVCFFVYQKKHLNKHAVYFFILFLFSLAFYNLMYAFLDMDLFRYYRPLHLFPFPYNWLIVTGLYFYVKNQLKTNKQQLYFKKEWYLFLPAVIYFLLRIYWFTISAMENSYRITGVIVASDFFRIQEFAVLLFNTSLLIRLLYLLKKQQQIEVQNIKVANFRKWLKLFIRMFLLLTLSNLLFFCIDMVIHKGRETFTFLYPTLISNAVFIYWIGFVGFTNPGRFFNNPHTCEEFSKSQVDDLNRKLAVAMKKQMLFRQPNLTIQQLAVVLGYPSKELSKFLNEHHQMNFPEYINHHRIEYIKELINSSEAEKYTLVTLAELSGFASKSSFNATFKKITGLTPSEFKKQQSIKI
jgi:AraC-like DNA-binding protein